MKISCLTFNIDKGKGFPRLLNVVQEHNPDVVAVQEFEPSSESISLIEKAGYTYAGHSPSFREFRTKFAVATFYRDDKLELTHAKRLNLQLGFMEVLLFFKGGRRSVISTCFRTKKNNNKFFVHNVHLTPYTTNTLRAKQIHKTLQSVEPHGEPTIVLGDFNYAYGRRRFEKIFKRYNFKEASNNIFYTFKSTLWFLPVKFKLDYVLYSNIVNTKTKQIGTFSPDHTPIIAYFDL